MWLGARAETEQAGSGDKVLGGAVTCSPDDMRVRGGTSRQPSKRASCLDTDDEYEKRSEGGEGSSGQSIDWDLWTRYDGPQLDCSGFH